MVCAVSSPCMRRASILKSTPARIVAMSDRITPTIFSVQRQLNFRSGLKCELLFECDGVERRFVMRFKTEASVTVLRVRVGCFSSSSFRMM